MFLSMKTQKRYMLKMKMLKCRYISADEVSAIYIVDTSDIDNLYQIAKIIQLNE